jgi:hypothetical protein
MRVAAVCASSSLILLTFCVTCHEASSSMQGDLRMEKNSVLLEWDGCCLFFDDPFLVACGVV